MLSEDFFISFTKCFDSTTNQKKCRNVFHLKRMRKGRHSLFFHHKTSRVGCLWYLFAFNLFRCKRCTISGNCTLLSFAVVVVAVIVVAVVFVAVVVVILKTSTQTKLSMLAGVHRPYPTTHFFRHNKQSHALTLRSALKSKQKHPFRLRY